MRSRRPRALPALVLAATPRLHGLRALPALLPALLAALVLAAAGCRASAPVAPAAAHPPPLADTLAAGYEPSRALGPLYAAVELGRLFPDSKTFADARPRADPRAILARYAAAREAPGFDLRAFVVRNFALPGSAAASVRTDTSPTMEAHIRALWPVLTRPADRPDPRSSLIPLPRPYVVPGGRFREVYYWDSYFTMLGLVRSGRIDLVRDMLDNFAHLVRTVGHVPNGNRTYYRSRSQPPFLAAMVGLYAAATDTGQALRYLPALEAEYAFWMDGASGLPVLSAGRRSAGAPPLHPGVRPLPGAEVPPPLPAPPYAYRRVLRLADGTLLNRYWDDRDDPRPESYREDVALALSLPDPARPALYRALRATAESGWDFSSRWLRDPRDLRTLETTRLAPIDLNSLMYNLERTIAALRRYRARPGDRTVAAAMERAADARRQALLRLAWDSATGFFYDVRWPAGAPVTDRPTLAAVAPLYFGLATPAQARAVAERLERDFLRPGGFVTTTFASGQQWDAPNGWPPLQWLAIEGLRRYGRAAVADTARARWLALLRHTWRTTGRMMEKYDVVDLTRPAGGGEYPTQDGFGWTNGVALALSAEEAGRPAVPTVRGAARQRQLQSGATNATGRVFLLRRAGRHPLPAGEHVP